MAEAKYFRAIWKYDTVVADEITDPDYDPQEKGISSGMRIIPVASGHPVIKAETMVPPRTIALGVIDARLDDGQLRLRNKDDEAPNGVRLMAKCSALNLDDDEVLYYTFSPYATVFNGGTQTIPTVTIIAPTVPDDHDDVVDGEVIVDLSTHPWVENAPSSAGRLLVENVPDNVTLVGPNLVQFWANGSPLGVPISLVTGGSGPSNTDDLPEGTANRYFTNGRVDARITAANLVAKAAESTAGFQFVDDDSAMAANSATKLATQRATRAYVAAKIAELIGAAPASLDTWTELVAAIQADQGAISGIMTTLGTKATPADITAASAALVGGATSAGNTLKKLEDLIAALSASIGGAPPMKFNTTTTTWPSRPAVSFPIFWVGGDAPVDRPPGYQPGDVWFPATGDDIDLGVVLEALQGITAAANTVPFFDAINHAASLAYKIAFSATPSHTAIVSEKTVKDYVDRMPTVTKVADYNVVGTDKGTMIQFNGAAAGTFTVTNDFDAGNVVSFRQIGTFAVTIAAGAGLTRDGAGGKFRTAGQFSECSIHFDTPTHFYVTGDLIV